MSARKSFATALLAASALVALEDVAFAQFKADPPGVLVAGSGSGRKDNKNYAPGMRFPIEAAPAYANSQVWGVGGNSGPAGSQSDKRNYSYPWHDNFCESRSYDMPLCPSGVGHQGQDIRAASAEKLKYWCVAAAEGTVTNIGSYSVYITTANGTRFDYLHMGNLQVKVGQKVTRGQRIGMVSNEFGGTPTTIHMHFNIRQNVAGTGVVYVPPYNALVESYKVLLDPATNKPEAGAEGGAETGTEGGTTPTDVGQTPTPNEPPATAAEPQEGDDTPPRAASDDAGGCNTSGGGTSTGLAAIVGLAVVAAIRARRRTRAVR